jgi:ABC-type branched-subunit amino acid transport system substrate-binding protein
LRYRVLYLLIASLWGIRMLSVLVRACKSLGTFALVMFALVGLAACVPAGGGSGPRVDTSAPVPVALLVPAGSGSAQDELLARNLVNAARLAISDLSGAQVDLRVYNTAGDPTQAANMAIKAVNEGAAIILGPLNGIEANAAGNAVAATGVNVLSFSNNADIAGGNVFVLGTTYPNIAARLANYAVRNGAPRIAIVHDQDVAGNAGRAAMEAAIGRAGGTLAGVFSYELSQNGIATAGPGIADRVRNSGANAVFLTATPVGALPLISQTLRDNGVTSDMQRFIGVSRWDTPREVLSLPGVQGGWFTLPDPTRYPQFVSRYQAAYGAAPEPIAALAYDGIAAVGALIRQGNANAFSTSSLTQNAGFEGVSGIFRFRADGTNERGLAVMQVQNGSAVVVDPAPRSFGGGGF